MMKQLLNKFYLLLALMCLTGTKGMAYDAQVNGIYYNLKDGTAEVTNDGEMNDEKFNSYSGSVEIPQTITYNGKDYPVTSIGDFAFQGSEGLTYVSIPEGIITIGDYAFGWCSALTEVIVPNTVTTIGWGAFAFCTNLSSVILSDNLTAIKGETFQNCTSLEHMGLPYSVTTIEDFAFLGCENFRFFDYYSSANLTFVSKFAFMNPIIPAIDHPADWEFEQDGIIYSGSGWFVTVMGTVDGFSGELVIPEKVTYVGEHYPEGLSYPVQAINGLFKNPNLTSVTIPGSVKELSNNWADCSNLTTLIISEGVERISDYSFMNAGITKLVIPNSVEYIGIGSFSSCPNLESLTIGSGMTSAIGWSFGGCTKLSSITVSEGNPRYDSRNNCNAIIETATNTLLLACNNTVIPSGITGMYDFAFSDCQGLTSLLIPKSMTQVAISSLSNCQNLASIVVEEGHPTYDSRDNCNAIIETATNKLVLGCKNTVIPSSVNAIASNSYICKGLTDLVIPNQITTIAPGAFLYGDDLTSIHVESGNTAYDSRNNCNAIMETATNTLVRGCKNTIIPTNTAIIGNDAFSKITDMTSLTLPDGVTSIGEDAFSGCKNLASITIPNSVTSIGDGAFWNCSSLTSIAIPEGVTSIDGSTFSGCGSLSSVTIGGNVTSIGEYAFSDCANLTSIDLPNTLTSIGRSAFQGCEKLSFLVIPEGVTSLGSQAFSGCEGLTSVTIPSTITSWGGNVFFQIGVTSITFAEGLKTVGVEQDFGQCSNLTSVVIPEGVTSIGNFTFSLCGKLAYVELPNSLTSIGAEAFADCSSLEKVVSHIQEPFAINNFMWGQDRPAFGYYTRNVDGERVYVAPTATLYVPTGTKAKYETTDGWKEFPNIVEMDETGVNDVRSKRSEVRDDIYNLNGQRINTPKRGLYILNGKKVVKR